jgi:hypothetical protein
MQDGFSKGSQDATCPPIVLPFDPFLSVMLP